MLNAYKALKNDEKENEKKRKGIIDDNQINDKKLKEISRFSNQEGGRNEAKIQQYREDIADCRQKFCKLDENQRELTAKQATLIEKIGERLKEMGAMKEIFNDSSKLRILRDFEKKYDALKSKKTMK